MSLHFTSCTTDRPNRSLSCTRAANPAAKILSVSHFYFVIPTEVEESLADDIESCAHFRFADLRDHCVGLETSRFMKQSDGENEGAPLTYRGARRIVWLIFFLVIVWFVLRSIQSVVLLFAIVLLIAMVLNPIVVWLQKHRVPRFVSVLLLILILIAIAGTIILFAIPPLARQSQELVHNAPAVWQGIRMRIESLGQNYPAVRDALPRTDEIAGKVGAAAGTVGNILLRSTIGLVGGLIGAVFAILLLIFVLANPQALVAGYLTLAPDRYREQAHRTLARLMRQMIAWARGVAINGAITGVSIGVLLWLIGVQPALMFGVFAFLGEFLPNVGPILVSIPILLVALSMGAAKFWLALGVIVLVYQVELNLLVPGVLGKEMRLHPVNILFFTLATATLFGILGAVLAVPAAALVQIVIDEFYLRPRKLDYAAIDREAAALVEGKK
jgi:putative permease